MTEIAVVLPDGSSIELEENSTVEDAAKKIGSGLAKAAVAGKIDGDLVDLRSPLSDKATLSIVTVRDEIAGEVIRHSAEHVMADAVKQLFPEAQVDVGRSDHSEKFQYDFLVHRPFTGEDLEAIEEKMNEILSQAGNFSREVVTRDEAREIFSSLGEKLKISRLDDIREGEEITLFRHGDFVDLCRGPHVANVSQIGAVKILDVAGAYWRGDEKNQMLQRIYGTAFGSRKELDNYVERVRLAKERDHRRIGAELDLFYLDGISPGSPFYQPKGMILYNTLVDYMRKLYLEYGYDEVMTPQVYRTDLFKTSGHYEMFREDMFLMQGDEGEELGVKPMNCPGHCLLFSSQKRSYRELPIRYAEFSRLHRNERSGTLTGLSRVRSMAQDDAHIFCENEKIMTEASRFFEMVQKVYSDLGLSGVSVSVSTRPEKFFGDPGDWDEAEKILIEAVQAAGYDCGIKEGEAAFYAPKVEFDFEDVLGRSWTLATLQIDLAMPARFELSYIGPDGQEHRPAMLHRAILGSLERFIAIYLEHTAGDLPIWMAPVQVILLPIADRHLVYASRVEKVLHEKGLRVKVDARSEKLGFKVREAELNKIPVIAVIGDKEEEQETVTMRRRSDFKRDERVVDLETFRIELLDETARLRN
tara:strand:- start:2027 stop:3955 length:1929 start_codon:yes stop_codon:yes gene_type:complete